MRVDRDHLDNCLEVNRALHRGDLEDALIQLCRMIEAEPEPLAESTRRALEELIDQNSKRLN